MSPLKQLLPFVLLTLYLQLRLCSALTEEEQVTDSSLTKADHRTPCFPDNNKITPCTCFENDFREKRVEVTCEEMASFSSVVQALGDKIERRKEIKLEIRFSDLNDLAEKKFKEIGAIISLMLRGNNVGQNLSTKSFEGIDTVTSLVLIETKISAFPGTIFQHMPNVETFTIERTPIESVSPGDFKCLTKLKSLIINSCNLTYIESNTFPVTLTRIDLRENNVSTLNQTLRNISLLEWVFLAHNNIESMEGQLADIYPNYKLSVIDVSFNKLTSFPKSFVELYNLNQLYANGNKIRSLDGILRKKEKLFGVDLSENQIDSLAPNEFEGCSRLAYLNLSYNGISSLNGSLIPLKSIEELNLTCNNLTEFSLRELPAGLWSSFIDVSHNKLRKFIAFSENETEITLEYLYLEFNELETLEGSMARVNDLRYLNISHNKLTTIPAEFLYNLKALQELDVSYNLLLTLHDMSKAGLTSLRQLYAINNQISDLSQIPSFKLSTVCSSYLQNNKIEKSNANYSEESQCAPEPGSDYILHIHLDGNDVLCKDNVQETINSVERSRNNTKIVGQCSKTLVEGVKYNVVPPVPVVNNTATDSRGAITVVTLEH